MNRKDPEEILPSTKRDEMVLDTTGALVNLVPGIGGAIASVLFGISGDRRFERVRDFLVEVDDRVGQLSEEQDAFVRGEEFEDLLTETLDRVARERSKEKRQVYANFLAETIDDMIDEPYDERLRFLRIVEDLQADHLKILRAMWVMPDPQTATMGGTRRNTLESRLPDMSPDRLRDLADQLGDLRLIDAGMLGPIVTGPSAIDLRPVIVPLGQRFMRFLTDESTAD